MPPASSEAATAACSRAAFRVVVDVGHTVDHPGADSARGATEYTFNLELADAITHALVDAGFDKTVRLITTTNFWQGLFERAERANAMHADLFIAIHHDSVPNSLAKIWEFAGRHHEYNDDYKGYSIFVSNDNGDVTGSLQFAHLLGKALQAHGMQYTPHYTLPLMGRHRRELIDADAGVYRYDQLVVLRYTRMPALLLEAGSIINRDEELEMARPERRALIAAAVTGAIEDFCAARARLTNNGFIRRPPHAAMQPGHADDVR
jgi:N-acetylmuramoyl-L-alanine amidase